MKKRFQKLAAIFLTGIMTATLLAGCGNSGNSEKKGAEEKGTEDSGENDSAETESNTEASAADIGEPNGGAEVTLWHYFEHEAKL